MGDGDDHDDRAEGGGKHRLIDRLVVAALAYRAERAADPLDPGSLALAERTLERAILDAAAALRETARATPWTGDRSGAAAVGGLNDAPKRDVDLQLRALAEDLARHKPPQRSGGSEEPAEVIDLAAARARFAADSGKPKGRKPKGRKPKDDG
ncbi:MAG: hypothetical protein ACPGNT_08140 [Rhodospirillales bacterium]